MVFKDNNFDQLNWTNEEHKELTFKNCLITNSNFSGANLSGLRLENCQLFNCNFEKADLGEGFFKDCIFYIR